MEKITLVKDNSISYKLIVTEELERKIRFLCTKSPNNEWSGILIYDIEGSIKYK